MSRTRLVWYGAAAKARIDRAASQAVAQAAEALLTEANRTVPIEEGTLQRSGGTDSDGAQATVYYDTPYARRQHEELGWAHDSGRRAKWLELALQENRRRLVDWIGEAIRKRL